MESQQYQYSTIEHYQRILFVMYKFLLFMVRSMFLSDSVYIGTEENEQEVEHGTTVWGREVFMQNFLFLQHMTVSINTRSIRKSHMTLRKHHEWRDRSKS